MGTGPLVREYLRALLMSSAGNTGKLPARPPPPRAECLRGDMQRRKPAPAPGAALRKAPSSSSSWGAGSVGRWGSTGSKADHGRRPWLSHVVRLLTVREDPLEALFSDLPLILSSLHMVMS